MIRIEIAHVFLHCSLFILLILPVYYIVAVPIQETAMKRDIRALFGRGPSDITVEIPNQIETEQSEINDRNKKIQIYSITIGLSIAVTCGVIGFFLSQGYRKEVFVDLLYQGVAILLGEIVVLFGLVYPFTILDGLSLQTGAMLGYATHSSQGWYPYFNCFIYFNNFFWSRFPSVMRLLSNMGFNIVSFFIPKYGWTPGMQDYKVY